MKVYDIDDLNAPYDETNENNKTVDDRSGIGMNKDLIFMTGAECLDLTRKEFSESIKTMITKAKMILPTNFNFLNTAQEDLLESIRNLVTKANVLFPENYQIMLNQRRKNLKIKKCKK